MIREDPYIVHLHCCQCRAPTSWSGPVISTGHQQRYVHVSSKMDPRSSGTSTVGCNWICCTWRLRERGGYVNAARVLCKCLGVSIVRCGFEAFSHMRERGEISSYAFAAAGDGIWAGVVLRPLLMSLGKWTKDPTAAEGAREGWLKVPPAGRELG